MKGCHHIQYTLTSGNSRTNLKEQYRLESSQGRMNVALEWKIFFFQNILDKNSCWHFGTNNNMICERIIYLQVKLNLK